MAAEFKVTYGSYICGPGGSAMIDGRIPHRFGEDFDAGKGHLEFDAIVYATTTAAFKTACDAFEAAFSTRFALLTITYGSTATVTITPSTYTRGTNTLPSFRKLGAPLDTGLSRRYSVTITWAVVVSATDGFRKVVYQVGYSPAGVRTLTVSGEVSAITTGAVNATAHYLANFATKCGTIKTLIGGDGWETKPVSNNFRVRDNNSTILDFVVVFDELVMTQSVGVLDDADLTRQTIGVDVRRIGPGDSEPEVIRPVEVFIAYSVHVKVDSSAAASAQTTVMAKWASKVRPWLLQHASALAQSSNYAVLDERPRYEDASRILTAHMSILFVDSDLLESTINVLKSDVPGFSFAPAVDEAGSIGHVVYPGPREFTVTRRERTVRRGRVTFEDGVPSFEGGQSSSGIDFVFTLQDGGGSLPVDSALGNPVAAPSGGGGGSGGLTKIPLRSDDDFHQIYWGHPSDRQIPAVERTAVTINRYVKLLGFPEPRGAL